MQNACCPNPDYPVIVPSIESYRMRKFLRYVLYGKIGYIIIYSILFGIFSGILQMISLWMIYSAWATMSFCSCIFLMIIFGLDLFMNIFLLQTAASLGGPILIMCLFLFLYSLIAFAVSYKAYKVWKSEFEIQHGGDNFQAFGGNQRNQ